MGTREGTESESCCDGDITLFGAGRSRQPQSHHVGGSPKSSPLEWEGGYGVCRLSPTARRGGALLASWFHVCSQGPSGTPQPGKTEKSWARWRVCRAGPLPQPAFAAMHPSGPRSVLRAMGPQPCCLFPGPGIQGTCSVAPAQRVGCQGSFAREGRPLQLGGGRDLLSLVPAWWCWGAVVVVGGGLRWWWWWW